MNETTFYETTVFQIVNASSKQLGVYKVCTSVQCMNNVQ